MEPKRFTTEDWYGFAGAENFKDGSAPFILETDRFILVGDATGISYWDDGRYPDAGCTMRLSMTPLMMQILLADLAKQINESAALDVTLKELGFERG